MDYIISDVFSAFKMQHIITFDYVIINQTDFVHPVKNLLIVAIQSLGSPFDA